MNVFLRIYALIKLRKAIIDADEAFARTGERHYVMPTSGLSGNLIIMDRKNFRKLKQKGYISYKPFISDLERECFYFTPYRNGSQCITPDVIKAKQWQYLNWCIAVRHALK